MTRKTSMIPNPPTRARAGAGVLLAALMAALPGVLTAGCAGGDAAPSTADSGYVAGDGAVTLLGEGDREPAPALSGTLLGGGALDPSAYAGKVLVVNVWGSWCAPCRSEAGTLERAYQATRAQGVEFVGVNGRDSLAAAQAFVRRFQISYPSIVDRDGRLQLAFRGSLPLAAFPSTVIIDRQGRAAARILGPVSETTLRDLIAEVS
jgi:thiol-disulfide isomerase/thioredoxin